LSGVLRNAMAVFEHHAEKGAAVSISAIATLTIEGYRLLLILRNTKSYLVMNTKACTSSRNASSQLFLYSVSSWPYSALALASFSVTPNAYWYAMASLSQLAASQLFCSLA
jgi:hypothetical protein